MSNKNTTQTHSDSSVGFEIHENLPDHHFRTETPNILYNINMDFHCIGVYQYLKSIAGDGGKCWKSLKTLCDQIGLGETKVRECIKKLAEINPKLGCALITITKRFDEKGSPLSSVISINNIWKINGDFYRSRTKKPNISDVSTVGGGVVRNTREGGSPREDKEEHKEEEPKQQQQKPKKTPPKEPATAGVVVDEKKLQKTLDKIKEHNLPFSESFIRKEANTRGNEFLGRAIKAYLKQYAGKEVANPNGLLRHFHILLVEGHYE